MGEEEISAGGSRMYRHDAPAGEPEIAHGDDALIEAVSQHVERHIGPIEQVFHELVSPTVLLDVLCVDPSDAQPWYTLVTCGMSAKPMRAPAPELAHAELALALPPDWPMEQEAWRDERHYWPIRLLKSLGRLPHEYETWLGNGHTIPNDDPPAAYAPGTALCGAIVAAPQLAPEEFALLERPTGPVRCYGVVALHAAELRFKLDRGADALYDRLAAAGVSELVDPGREAVVEAPRRRGRFRRR